MNPQISIIMPVYNAKFYVRKAIESVLNQSFESIELILVDDGSCDGSASICDEFSSKDSRVIVVHQENHGTSFARNVGLSIAKGEYVTFCDHDDEYSAELLKENYDFAKKYDADVICSSVKIFYPNGKGFLVHTLSQPTKIYYHENQIELVAELKYNNNTLFGYVWNHLYRRELIQELKFDTNFKHGHEDQVFNMNVLNRLNGPFVFNSSACYHHFSRPNSSSKNLNEDLVQENLLLFDYEYAFARRFANANIDNGGHVLVADLYVLYDKCISNSRKNLKLFRKCDYIAHYPLALSISEKVLLFCFRTCFPLFKFLCKMNWARYIPGEKEMTLSGEEALFWDTPICGFLLNLFKSERNRWLFDLCNFGVKVITLPFRLFK